MPREPLADRVKNGRHLRRAVIVPVRAVVLTLAGPFIAVWRSLRDVGRDPQTQNILIASGALLISGMFLFRWIEDFRWLDSFYFSFITLATIGYGDFSPATDAGKLVTILYSIAGLGILAALIKAIATHGRTRSRARHSAPSDPGTEDTREAPG